MQGKMWVRAVGLPTHWLYRGETVELHRLSGNRQEGAQTGGGCQCVYPRSPPAPGESSACVYVSDGDGRVVPGLEDYSCGYWCVCFLVQIAFQRHPPSDRTLLTNFKTGWSTKYLTWPRRVANHGEWGRRICDSSLFWVNQGMNP